MGKSLSPLVFIIVSLGLAAGLLMTLRSRIHQPRQQKRRVARRIGPLTVKTKGLTMPTSNRPGRSRVQVKIITHKPELVEDTPVLVPLSRKESVVLIDREGKILHSWPVDAYRARMVEGCRLLVAHGSVWGENHTPWSGLRKSLWEYSWSGEATWRLTVGKTIHHDFQRLPNGNTLFLVRDEFRLPRGSEIMGKMLDVDSDVRFDLLVETDSLGNVVWAWDSRKHLSWTTCGERPCEDLREPRQFRDSFVDWTHTNTVSIIPENRWFLEGDSRFRPGNIMLIPRNLWSILIVDKDTGEVVWTFSGASLKHQGLIRGHEAQMIPEDLPGAGNVLLFDNGLDGVREYSVVREIRPDTGAEVWSYTDPRFYSHAAGSVTRLKNGNTFISQDRGNSRVLEVTPSGMIAWEAVFPGAAPSRAHPITLEGCLTPSESLH